MEISERYKIEAALLAAEKEMAEKFRSKGYAVTRDYKHDNFACDLYVEKDNLKFAFEFKTRGKLDHARLDAMRDYAKEHNIHFRVVIVRLPVDKQINVNGIEQTLEQNFINNIPDELDSLSSNTKVVEVEQAILTSISIKTMNHIEIEGKSGVVVDLCFDNDDYKTSDSFPFTFNGIWGFSDEGELQLIELKDLNIDTSSYSK